MHSHPLIPSLLTGAPPLFFRSVSNLSLGLQIVFPQVDELQLDRILAENRFDVESAAAAIAADLDIINAPPQREEVVAAGAEQEKPSWLAALFSGFGAKAEEPTTATAADVVTSSVSRPAAPSPPPTPQPALSEQQKQDGGAAAPFFGLLSGGRMNSSAPCEPIHTPLAWTPCAEPEITSISSESWETQWAVVAAPAANPPIDVPPPAPEEDKAFLTPSPSWASFEVEHAGAPAPKTQRSTSISSSSGATSPGTISYSGDSDEPEDEALNIDEDALLITSKHELPAPGAAKSSKAKLMMPDVLANQRRPSATPVGGF